MKSEKNIKLSVFMITYNHEKYIKQAIDSVLMQETDFEFELVIGEDCSSDKTREICVEYQKKYPEKINLIVSDYNVGVCKNGLRTWEACRGRYIAYLEGDDYWTSKSKLQKQVDFLDKNPDFSLCFHGEEIVDDVGKSIVQWGRSIKEISNLQDICSINYICSNTVVFRNRVDINLVFNHDFNAFDWILWVFIAQYGDLYFINKVMSAYRVHSGGVFSLKSEIDKFLLAENAANEWHKLIGDKCNEEYENIISVYYFSILELALVESKKELVQEYLQKISLKIPTNEKYIDLLRENFINRHEVTCSRSSVLSKVIYVMKNPGKYALSKSKKIKKYIISKY